MSNPEFLIFSLPNSTSWFRGKLTESTEKQLSAIVIKPFQGEFLIFDFTKIESIEVPIIDLPPAPTTYLANQSHYETLVRKTIKICKKTNGKIVVSRCAETICETKNIQEKLEQLRVAFPAAFIYLLNCKKHGAWLGATPETLVKKAGDQFETHAVAGTKWNNDPFTKKEFDEQQLVVDSILNDLSLNSESTEARGELAFGAIRHLETKIKWQSNETLEKIALKLHPTPAVNGWPKKEATDFILQNEGYDRELYTGFIALNIPHIAETAFVNLRCMQLFRDRIRFYIGGGINALSNPASEWEETEKKMNTLLDAMQIYE